MNRPESLLHKELDGECTASEGVELDRSEWTNPDLRRSRDAWRRTKAAMSALGPTNPPVPVDRWAQNILQHTRPPTAPEGGASANPTGWVDRIGSAVALGRLVRVVRSVAGENAGGWTSDNPPAPSRSLRVWPWGAWGLAATAGLLVFLWPDAMESTALAPSASLRGASPVAPVEVRIDAPAVDERDQVPVSIRF